MLEDGSLGELPAQASMVLPVVLSKLDEIGRMVDQMLDTARLDDSCLHLDLQVADLGRVVDDAFASLRPSPRHTAVLEVPADPLPCVIDPERVTTVLHNLLANAVKYSPAGGEVRCTVRREGGVAQVSVRDQGMGIDAEGLSLLFTRFGRVPTPATRGIPGTGLGLYVSRELARRHGGDLSVESRPGEGSTFTLTLPLTMEVASPA
jgi:signal transduction histidine kinase